MNLLNTNTKLLKQNGNRYLIAGLTLAPHRIGGQQVCTHATEACMAACVLWFTGRTVTQSVRHAMIRRKRLLFENPVKFEALLRADIESHILAAENKRLTPTIRLNVASDLDWRQLIADYPEAKFYDYTKVRSRLFARKPDNYELTYSLNERSSWQTARAQLSRGGNVAAIFSTRYHPQSGRIDPLPDSWTIGKREYQIVDGDVHDVRLRETDGSGVIVGLRFKGSLRRRQKAIERGFCLNAD